MGGTIARTRAALPFIEMTKVKLPGYRKRRHIHIGIFHICLNKIENIINENQLIQKEIVWTNTKHQPAIIRQIVAGARMDELMAKSWYNMNGLEMEEFFLETTLVAPIRSTALAIVDGPQRRR